MTTSLAERPIFIRSCGVKRYSDSCNWTFCDDWSPIKTSDGERAMPNEDINLEESLLLLSIIWDEKCMHWADDSCERTTSLLASFPIRGRVDRSSPTRVASCAEEGFSWYNCFVDIFCGSDGFATTNEVIVEDDGHFRKAFVRWSPLSDSRDGNIRRENLRKGSVQNVISFRKLSNFSVIPFA